MKTITWRCPSNIALVKYWGKHGVQLPCNPSISFTLQNAYTEMQLTYQQDEKDDLVSLDFYFENKPNEKFKEKIYAFITKYIDHFPSVRKLHLTIHSHNSFPHSTGIASSASSMGALALCLCSLEKELSGQFATDDEFYQKASYLARLASGSACRSVYPYLALWGETSSLKDSSDTYAVPFTTFHPVFQTYQNRILIVSSAEKSVSSRAGHALMNNHPFAKSRYEQAHENIKVLLQVLQIGDLQRFAEIVETEALTLHALMMNSSPSVILMQPNTLIVLEKIKQFRETSQLPISYTLDAGPNIHLLYPLSVAKYVNEWIGSDLVGYLENGKTIADCVGKGSIKL